MFSHIVVNPGCSIGYHDHQHETEFYYILRGEAVFNDDGTEVPVHPGDICATGFGQHHALENRGKEPVELIALIVTGKKERLSRSFFCCPAGPGNPAVSCKPHDGCTVFEADESFSASASYSL